MSRHWCVLGIDPGYSNGSAYCVWAGAGRGQMIAEGLLLNGQTRANVTVADQCQALHWLLGELATNPGYDEVHLVVEDQYMSKDPSAMKKLCVLRGELQATARYHGHVTVEEPMSARSWQSAIGCAFGCDSADAMTAARTVMTRLCGTKPKNRDIAAARCIAMVEYDRIKRAKQVANGTKA